VGIVTRSHPTQGVIAVKIQNGFEMDELHDVSAQNPSNNDILQFKTATNLWTKVAGSTTNIAEGTNLYYTDARSRGAFSESVTGLDYNSTTGVLSTTTGYGIPTTASQSNWDAAYNDKINSAAVTGTTTKTLTLTQQDGGTVTASWTDINTDAVSSVFGRTGAVVAVSGDYTTAQVTESGNLYFTNGRARSAISLTTTGSSGAATYTEATGVFNIPSYTLSGLGGEPTITAGTTAQYWRGDKSWQTLNTANVPELTNLYFTDARARAAITLTTTGTSGAATYSAGVLNIPNYAPDLSGYVTLGTAQTISGAKTFSETLRVLKGGRTLTIGQDYANHINVDSGVDIAININNGNITGGLDFYGGTAVKKFSVSAAGVGFFFGNLSAANLSGTNTGDQTLAGLGGQAQLNGTGFVKATGTTITYDNSSYYLASNPSGYISSYTETDTLASVVARGSTTLQTISVGDGSTGLSGVNIRRGRLCFSNSYEANHSIYNNSNNIDSEGAWDGMKMNVYLGLDIRTGSHDAATNVVAVRPAGVVVTGNISATNLSGTNTGDQTLSGLGGVPTSRTLTINGTAYDLSANRTWTISAGVSGSGTTDFVPKWTGGTSLGDSLISSGSTSVAINGNTDAVPLRVITTTGTNSRVGFKTTLAANSYNVSVGAYSDNNLGFWTVDVIRGYFDTSGV
jgi:hypothetical protein